MYAFIWLHLITPACFWKLEFPSNCSGSGGNAACRLQALLLQKLLRVFAATFTSPDDSHPGLLSCSVGSRIKELSITGADGTGRGRLEPLFSSRSLVPFGRVQQSDQSCRPCSDEDFDKADSHTLATLPSLSPHPEFRRALHFGIF